MQTEVVRPLLERFVVPMKDGEKVGQYDPDQRVSMQDGRPLVLSARADGLKTITEVKAEEPDETRPRPRYR